MYHATFLLRGNAETVKTNVDSGMSKSVRYDANLKHEGGVKMEMNANICM